MTTVQDAYDLPDDIATGVLTGLYKRIGSVVRYNKGPKKGQIVKHLTPINPISSEQAQGLGAKALWFSQQHKKEIGFAAIGATIIGLGLWSYVKWKNHEPKVLAEFRVSLKDYIDAIRNGTMNIEKINSLIKTLDALKKHKDYEKIHIQLTAEELGILVGHIYEYTKKLASDNSVELTDEELCLNKDVFGNLQSYLITQKRIFKAVA